MFRRTVTKTARQLVRQPARLSAMAAVPRAMTAAMPAPALVGANRLFATMTPSTSTSNAVCKPKMSLMVEVCDTPGSLQDVLKFFWKHEVNMTRIESRPVKSSTADYSFYIDFDGRPEDEATIDLLDDLKRHCKTVTVINTKKVAWFPRNIKDLDCSVAQTLDAGDELESDHPGFNDKVYRARRDQLTDIALKFRQGQEIPRIDYTPDEIKTWGTVYSRMQDLWAKHACDEFKAILPLLENNCGYAVDNIPQAQDISDFLKQCTGFTLRPVTGLLSSRDFLNGLAFRVFFSTQYLRHHTMPLYTPEPDICHELMGHAPMFADPDFADFSHEIGLASLGASDEEIERLATCYWFSVEFGVCMQHGEKKAYGAGLLSSFGELEYACSPTRPAGGEMAFPEYRPWDPYQAAKQKYPITTYQPVYYVAESLSDAKERMRDFYEDMKKPFHARYHPYQQTISVDRAVCMEAKKQK
ncbi:phenylalanine-4-hydroxylase, henna-like protein [Achlya hypogyna]|uniref:phenylalanine 4-monooxygenase n=1 Tax=Achlya hypogyna TaxID=1202772 RepID=A0A1V9YD60_ACHHY|nr:phenylalanine-4-hydroxylase, henna-like protein [Achlya hypogyna]